MLEFFETKNIFFGDDSVTILVQNENGPCPLVALVNTVVLNVKNPFHPALKNYIKGKETVSVKGLLEILAEQLFKESDLPGAEGTAETHSKDLEQGLKQEFGIESGEEPSAESETGVSPGPVISDQKNAASPSTTDSLEAKDAIHAAQQQQQPVDTSQPGIAPPVPNPGSSAASDQDTNHVLKLLPSLVTGLNVNVRFDGTFDDTPEMSLFRRYDVDVVHGWVCDPEDPEHDTLAEVGSYDQSQSIILKDSESQGSDPTVHAQAEAASHFLASHATQLTPYGLQFLRDLLSSDYPAVLFRNDHFSTVYKRNGTLYALLADYGYKEETQFVWQSLADASGSNDGFYNYDFTPSGSGQAEQPLPERPDENRDYDIARQMQADDDAALAAELDRTYREENITAPRAERTRREARTSSTPKAKKRQGPSRSKNCSVM